MTSDRRPNFSAIIAVALVALIIGIAFGSIAFPQTKNGTTTELTTLTSTTTLVTNAPGQSSYPTITITYQIVDVYQVVGTCTTISGSATVVYTYARLGEITSVTYIYPPEYAYHPPSSFFAIVTTNSTAIQSNHTQPYTGSC
ncbi:MAG: hypothetical protein JRN15_11050 [Nitrososphaerota archaeon]|nr:hypothetical protein [Nitrososphaerota archaeon]